MPDRDFRIGHHESAAGAALVNLGRQRVLWDPQFITKETDLVLLRFEVVQILVGQNEVQKHEAGTHEIEGVPFTVAEVVLVDLSVDGAGKQMKDGAPCACNLG